MTSERTGATLGTRKMSPHVLCISCLSHCYDKLPNQRNLGERGFLWAPNLRVQSNMVGKAWWQEHEAGVTWHPVRKQKEVNTGAQLSFSFLFSPVPQSMRWGCPRLEWSSFLLNLSGTLSEIHQRASKTAQQLREHRALAEDLSLVPKSDDLQPPVTPALRRSSTSGLLGHLQEDKQVQLRI